MAIADEEIVTPGAVLRYAKVHGGRAALDKYFDCAGDDFNGYKHVGSGDAKWLNVGIQLLPYVDGCSGELMNAAFAESIVHSPSEILALVKSKTLSLEDVCFPQIWSIEEGDSRFIRAHVSRVRSAVLSVTDPALKGLRNSCVQYLKGIDRELDKKDRAANAK